MSAGREVGMQLSIVTVSLSGDLAEKLAAIAAAGFTGVEIFETDLMSFAGTPQDVKAMATKLGLKIVDLQPLRDFEGMPGDRRAQKFAEAERKFDLMAGLGTDLLMVCSNVSPEAGGGIERAAADLRELGERAARRGMRIGFEALAWGRHTNDYQGAWEAVRRAGHPAVGLILDAFHILARKTDLSALRAIPADKIFLVQISDAPMLDIDYMTWSRNHRCFPGEGAFPLGDFLDAIELTGYRGPLSLEIFNAPEGAGSAKDFAANGYRALAGTLDGWQRKAAKPPSATLGLKG